jgi:hypothetical protein
MHKTYKCIYRKHSTYSRFFVWASIVYIYTLPEMYLVEFCESLWRHTTLSHSHFSSLLLLLHPVSMPSSSARPSITQALPTSRLTRSTSSIIQLSDAENSQLSPHPAASRSHGHHEDKRRNRLEYRHQKSPLERDYNPRKVSSDFLNI